MKQEDLVIAINKDGKGEDPIVKKLLDKVWLYFTERVDDTYDGILMMLIGRLKHETGSETAKVLDALTKKLEST